jgi:hypothetical protein
MGGEAPARAGTDRVGAASENNGITHDGRILDRRL